MSRKFPPEKLTDLQLSQRWVSLMELMGFCVERGAHYETLERLDVHLAAIEAERARRGITLPLPGPLPRPGPHPQPAVRIDPSEPPG
jgi:hypothetical protein